MIMMSCDINAVVESLILAFNEWYKLHIKLFSLSNRLSEQSPCEAVNEYTPFFKVAKAILFESGLFLFDSANCFRTESFS